jgi:hypothetical protein
LKLKTLLVHKVSAISLKGACPPSEVHFNCVARVLYTVPRTRPQPIKIANYIILKEQCFHLTGGLWNVLLVGSLIC